MYGLALEVIGAVHELRAIQTAGNVVSTGITSIVLDTNVFNVWNSCDGTVITILGPMIYFAKTVV